MEMMEVCSLKDGDGGVGDSNNDGGSKPMNPLDLPAVREKISGYVLTTHGKNELLKCRLLNRDWNKTAVALLKKVGDCTITLDRSASDLEGYLKTLSSLDNYIEGPQLDIKLKIGDHVINQSLVDKVIHLLEANREWCLTSIEYDTSYSSAYVSEISFFKLVGLASKSLETLYFRGGFNYDGNYSNTPVVNVLRQAEGGEGFPKLKSIYFQLGVLKPAKYLEVQPMVHIVVGQNVLDPFAHVIGAASALTKLTLFDSATNERVLKGLCNRIVQILTGLRQDRSALNFSELEIDVYDIETENGLNKFVFPQLLSMTVHQYFLQVFTDTFVQFVRDKLPVLRSFESYLGSEMSLIVVGPINLTGSNPLPNINHFGVVVPYAPWTSNTRQDIIILLRMACNHFPAMTSLAIPFIAYLQLFKLFAVMVDTQIEFPQVRRLEIDLPRNRKERDVPMEPIPWSEFTHNKLPSLNELVIKMDSTMRQSEQLEDQRLLRVLINATPNRLRFLEIRDYYIDFLSPFLTRDSPVLDYLEHLKLSVPKRISVPWATCPTVQMDLQVLLSILPRLTTCEIDSKLINYNGVPKAEFADNLRLQFGQLQTLDLF